MVLHHTIVQNGGVPVKTPVAGATLDWLTALRLWHRFKEHQWEFTYTGHTVTVKLFRNCPILQKEQSTISRITSFCRR